jgi:hypothetical protein
MNKQLNFLWQDHSAYDNATATKVAKLNPDKFLINVDGPGSDFSNPQCGPSIPQLVQFVTNLKKKGFSGSLVMHPDATKGDYQHDWNGKGNLPTRDTSESWMSYCDYFREMNDALNSQSLPVFEEILIEGEGSYIPRTPLVFDDIKRYLKAKCLVSTTGDWNGDRENLHVDCFYPQLYDMGYVDTALKGENLPSKKRAVLLAQHITDIIKEKPAMLDDPNVFFTFSYCFNDDDAPVFGQPPRIWSEVYFNYFLEKFREALSAHTTKTINAGVWHSSVLLDNWKISKNKKAVSQGRMLFKHKMIWWAIIIALSILVGVYTGQNLVQK